MARFTYTGETAEGEKVDITVDATDRYAVYEIARQNGHIVHSIDESRRFSLKFFNVARIEAAISRVSEDNLVMMTRNLGSMLTAGLPLSRALSVIERQSNNPKLKQVIIAVRDAIQKGDPFGDALAKHPHVFNELYVSMVRAGDESGKLADTLRILSIQMERASSLRKKIKGAMIYPAIVLVIMAAIGVLMMIYVMPSITGTFKSLNVDLPVMTQVLISTSDLMVAHTVVVLLGMVSAVIGFIYFAKTWVGKKVLHYLVLHLPIIGVMVRETNAARTSRTLASLLTAGVDVIRALSITRDVVQNVYFKPIIDEAIGNVEKGSPLSEAFVTHNKLYPIFVGEMILVGEETGGISEMLEQLANFYESEVEHKTKDLSTIIEPLLMVVIGGTVGFFALAMITPIYSISDSIG